MVLGIIGAGKLGMTLARLARQQNIDVTISGSGAADKIALSVEVLAPGARAATSSEIAQACEVVVLALPLGKFRTLPATMFDGKLVIDAMNYWWEVDGPREAILPKNVSSSQAVQEYFKDARVVKAFSHMGYHDLFDESQANDDTARKAIAVAGDNQKDIAAVAKLVDALGFDPVLIGALHEGRKLEPSTSLFGASITAPELKARLADSFVQQD